MSLTNEQIAQLTELELDLLRGHISSSELLLKAKSNNLPIPDYLLDSPAQAVLPQQPITITLDQLTKRDEWEQMLMRREITLADALALQMAIGVPIGDYSREMFERALDNYQDGSFSDLAEPLGVAMTKREKNAEKSYLKKSNIVFHVDLEHKNGKPKTDPNHFEGTAFEAAGDRLGLSSSHVYDIYYSKK